MNDFATSDGSATAWAEADFERRFGGLRRLYGHVAAQRVFDAHVVVVGIGGVGSWTAEALARSGVGHLTLIDLDHIAESNVNRQIHALTPTLGQAKVEAMRQRIADINPAAHVQVIDDFVTPDNWLELVQRCHDHAPGPFALIDACDQMSAKTALAVWALQHGAYFVTVGAAGGKRAGHAVEVADLATTTHDPLLAQLRYRLRKHHQASRTGNLHVLCVFSREPVQAPSTDCAVPNGASDGSLNCHGYGSSVTVTATFGLCAAGVVIDMLATGKKITKKLGNPSKPQKMPLQ